MAKTLVDIDPDLLAQAGAILGEKTKTGTVTAALRQVVAEKAKDDLIDYFAGLDDDQRAALAGARDQW